MISYYVNKADAGPPKLDEIVGNYLEQFFKAGTKLVFANELEVDEIEVEKIESIEMSEAKNVIDEIHSFLSCKESVSNEKINYTLEDIKLLLGKFYSGEYCRSRGVYWHCVRIESKENLGRLISSNFRDIGCHFQVKNQVENAFLKHVEKRG